VLAIPGGPDSGTPCAPNIAGKSRSYQTVFLRLSQAWNRHRVISAAFQGHMPLQEQPRFSVNAGSYLVLQRLATVEDQKNQLQEGKCLPLGKEAWDDEICDFITNLVGIDDSKICACITLVKMKYKMDYLVLNERDRMS